ncbi:MAG TPA: VOC family protein [Acidimicrobiales bacterium]|nr:VOC family protein [Acidimicrobiales bacterium]
MSTAEVGNSATSDASVGKVDMKLEVVVIPVSDVDRATEFYASLGWRQDVTPPGSGVVQFTPPGSGCSVQFGTNLTSAAPGSAQRTFLVVSDIEAARNELVAAGIEVSEVFHRGPDGQVSGPDPEHRSYGSFASFSDPDGNSWLFQEITTRLPGRIDSAATSFGSATDLASAMRRASAAHGEHEERVGEADANWPDWYAAYMVAEQAGKELPS